MRGISACFKIVAWVCVILKRVFFKIVAWVCVEAKHTLTRACVGLRGFAWVCVNQGLVRLRVGWGGRRPPRTQERAASKNMIEIRGQ